MLKELTDLGFSPVNAGLILTVIALVKFMLSERKRHEEASEARHDETRKRVEEMNVHVDDCNKDRETLKVQVATLSTRMERMDRCPRANCPLRLP